MYKVYELNTLDVFKSMFVCNSSIHSHDTRQADNFHLPQVKKNLSKTCLSYRGAVIWNDILNHDVQIHKSEVVFCKDFKSKLLGGVL